MESGEKDLLSKQAILNLPRDKEFNLEGKLLAEYINVKDIEALPTVQSQSTAGQLNDSAQSTNLIDRQQALEAVSDCGICTQKLVEQPTIQCEPHEELLDDGTLVIWTNVDMSKFSRVNVRQVGTHIGDMYYPDED